MGSASTVPTPWGEVSSLNCVYLLAPCRENLPINSALILLGSNPAIFLIHTRTSVAPPHLPSTVFHPCCSALTSEPCRVSDSLVHTRNRQTHGFECGDTRGGGGGRP